jgi:phosphate transport system ATP-binding protein
MISPLQNPPPQESAEASAPSPTAVLSAQGVSVRFGTVTALRQVSLEIPSEGITAIIGPSGCGKTVFLRCFNRMNELVPQSRTEGFVGFKGIDIHAPEVDVIELRKRVGMVFQRPNPFPKSIFENVAYGLRLHGLRDRSALAEAVERSLRDAALWDEVKDRLPANALSLSGGQQQRLCIARALAVRPQVLLMDEPASALDPIATARIEELIHDLRRHYPIVVVTHNMHQAARISDFTAFLYQGELVEYDRTRRIFSNPSQKRTEDYVTGRFG